MCDCDFCKWHQEFKARITRIIETDDQAFFQDLADRWLEAEMDRDYYRAIVKNQWPDGDKILARYRCMPNVK